jgi:tetraprenyl-beta-curcumene synthase
VGSRLRVPAVLRRDLRRTLRVVFSHPSRIRRLLALGPRGWSATARFLISVVPRAGRELAAIRARAERIPDAALREQALASIDGKAYHVQGGCILATFMHADAAHRYIAIVAALETIYDYLDNLCDRLPGVTQQAFATLHESLIDALDDRRTPGDYYRDGPPGDDGGYLRSLVDTARAGLRALPNYAAVRERLVDVARFYADLQVHKHGPAGERERACDAWYARNRERFPGLAWWEFAAACGSSLPVFALIDLASRERIDPAEIDATVAAYFPGVSALHILLDYFIDQAEDREHGELNFVACYPSPAEAVTQLRKLVAATLERVRDLAGAARHRFVVEAMCVFYLTHPKVFEQRLDRESAALLRALAAPPAR